jgi:phage repressor protein C with HTH and peptisase S24 domain
MKKLNSPFPWVGGKRLLRDHIISLIPKHRCYIEAFYVVITDESEATVKQVWKKESGYELVAFNPEHRNQFYPFEQIIRLIRVVEIQRTYE